MSRCECYDESRPCKKTSKKSPVYGEFIRTFTFNDGVSLPIVQPGGALTFPIATVPPKGVTYIEDSIRVGLLVPGGIYRIRWELRPGIGASIDLLVNGIAPTSLGTGFPYTRAITTTERLNFEYLISAPFRKNNFISIINSGSTLFGLSDIPNTQIGNTSVITHVYIQRIDQ